MPGQVNPHTACTAIPGGVSVTFMAYATSMFPVPCLSQAALHQHRRMFLHGSHGDNLKSGAGTPQQVTRRYFLNMEVCSKCDAHEALSAEWMVKGQPGLEPKKNAAKGSSALF